MDEAIAARLGIEYLSVLGLPPVEFVQLASRLGCRNVSMGFTGSYVNPAGHPPYNLAEDRALRADVAAALADCGVSISLGEGFLISPDSDVRDRRADFEVWRALSVSRVNVVSVDPDLERTLDQIAQLVDIALSEGMAEVVMEFAPVLTISDLPTALRALDHIGNPACKLIIDTMHFGRTGGTAQDLARVPAGSIGYVQLCDVPVRPHIESYMEEAMTERLPPGQGELPLLDYLRNCPPDAIVSLEIPQAGLVARGASAADLLAPAVAAAGELLRTVAAEREA